MNVTLRQLTIFEAVARHLNITRAAEELYLTQPAVSMQIKQMENSIGLPLYELMGKRIHLTEAGETMQRCARAIGTQLRETEQTIEEIKGEAGGRLRITVASTVNYFATQLLSEFCRGHPRVQVSLDVTNRQTLLHQLQENTTDVVLMGQPPGDIDVIAEPFMQNPLVVIASPDHPLSRRRRIALKELRDETFLMREPGSGTRIAMERFLSDKGLVPSSCVEMTSNEAIKQSVQVGLGLGVVSAHTVELEFELGRLVTLNVDSFPIMRRWYVVHRKGKRLSAAAKTFKDYVLRTTDLNSKTPAGTHKKRSDA